MTKEQLAALLDGREYGDEITREERETAKAGGLVVVYSSDDYMWFDGAIRDRIDYHKGGTAYLNKFGLRHPLCSNKDCVHEAAVRTRCKTIEAVWDADDSAPWTYETDIPHATFDIYEDGELWCVGLVFEMDALKGVD